MIKEFSFKKLFLFAIVFSIVICVLFCLYFSISKSDSSDISNTRNDALEFVYLDSSQLNVGDTQQIFVSYNEKDNAVNSKLNFHVEGEDMQSVAPSAVIDGVAKYEIPCLDESSVGKYTLDYASWESPEEGQQKIECNAERGYSFSVSKPIESLDNNDLADIYKINADGSFKKADSFSDAVNNGDAQMMFGSDAANLNSANGNLVIALDAGHGGSDPGACGSGLRESDINLKIATACYNKLREFSGCTPYMVRSYDVTVGLEERVNRAVGVGANVFVSFHINAGGGTGYEVWVQNSSSYLYNLHNESVGLASVIRAKLARFGWYDRGSKQSDYPQDGSPESVYPDGSVADYLSVLRNSRRHGMPAVLIEHGFIDNPGDVARLADDNFLTALGIADAEAIAEFYNIGKYAIVNGTYEIEMVKDNSIVLDVEGQSSADKAKITTAKHDDKKLTQRWRVVTDPNSGNAVLLNVANNKALDLIDGDASAHNGLQQLVFNDQNGQKWHFFNVDGDDNTFNISTSCNDGMYIDVENGSTMPGAKVQIYNNNGNIAQKFKLKKVDNTDEAVEINGTFKITTKLDSKKALDVQNGSTDSGAAVQLYEDNGSIAQKWHIWTDPDTKLVTMVCCCSGHVIDVSGGYAGPNAYLQQYIANYSLAQQWKIVSVSGGGYRFMSANNENLAMDVVGGQTESGTRLWTYYMTGTNSEVFYLTDCHADVPGSNIDINEANYYKINSALSNNMALDVNGGSILDGTPLDIYHSSGAEDFNKSQIFKFESVNKTIKGKTGKYYRITNVYSNKTVSAGNGQLLDGTGVKQAYTNSFNDERQLWAAYSVDGKIKFKNLASGLYLDVDGGIAKDLQPVEVNSEKSSSSQKWNLLTISRHGEDINGTYYISMQSNNNYMVDIANGSKDITANAQIYEANGSNAQKWEISTKNGLSLIKNVGSGKYLNVAGGQAYSGCNVWQYTNDGTNACYWKFIKNSLGNYEIVSALNDFYSLDAAGGIAANGTNVQIYSSGDSVGQGFKLQDMSGKHGEQVNGDFIFGSALSYASVLDVSGGSKANGANVQIYQSNNSAAQKWHVVTDANGLATIQNVNSGLFLDVCGGATVSGTNVWQYEGNSSLAQRWKFISANIEGEYEIVSALNDYLTLDISGGSTSNGSNIQIYKCNGTNAQRFNLFNLQPKVKTSDIVTPNSYRIYPSSNSGYSLDLSAGSRYDGGNIQIWAYDANTPNQIFTVENAVNGFYYIKCFASGKYLDVDGGCVVPGTNVQQWSLIPGNPNQMWAFYNQGGESYIIMNVASGLVLDINSGVLISGQNVQGYKQNNTPAQKWSMAYVDPKSVFYPIMQSQTHSSQQMVNLFNSYHKNYPAVYASKGAKTIDEWCNIAVEEANYEGVDPSVLFAQAMHETGWLQFGGLVRDWQCNFGGLGATGGDIHGAQFDDVRTGLRAQVQHLKGYASIEPLKNECVDPRWADLISMWGRGSAPFLELLNGKWAVPGDGYGQAIREIINRL